MYSDDVWNLVFVHQTCNSKKSNILPEEGIIQKLEEPN
ncbi:HNH endonuclease domain-containing protein [Paenibacillus sp. BGI2013]|nr:HNH endonuclease domain-containing protein [Paenibacillus sp. BGI2013]